MLWHDPRVVNIFDTGMVMSGLNLFLKKKEVNMKINEDGRVSASHCWCTLRADLNMIYSNGKKVAARAKTKIQFTDVFRLFWSNVFQIVPAAALNTLVSGEDDVSFADIQLHETVFGCKPAISPVWKHQTPFNFECYCCEKDWST